MHAMPAAYGAVVCALHCRDGVMQHPLTDMRFVCTLRVQLCFKRAGDTANAKLCQAEQQVVLARRSQDQPSANRHYLQAAALYKDLCRCGWCCCHAGYASSDGTHYDETFTWPRAQRP